MKRWDKKGEKKARDPGKSPETFQLLCCHWLGDLDGVWFRLAKGGLPTVARFNGCPQDLSFTSPSINISQCGIMLIILELPLQTRLTVSLCQSDVVLRLMETRNGVRLSLLCVTPLPLNRHKGHLARGLVAQNPPLYPASQTLTKATVGPGGTLMTMSMKSWWYWAGLSSHHQTLTSWNTRRTYVSI